MKYLVYKHPVPIHAQTIALALQTEITDRVEPCDGMIFPFVCPQQEEIVQSAKKQGITTVGFWLGSDSWKALKQPMLRSVLPKFDVDLCVHERIQSELESWNRKAHIVYSAVRQVPEPKPLQAQYPGAYVPNHTGVYQFETMCQIAEAIKPMPMAFYGVKLLPRVPSNVRLIKHQSPEEASRLLDTLSCLVRMTDHDGLPQNLIEMKMRGRPVIASFPYRHCYVANNWKLAADIILSTAGHQFIPKHALWYQKNCSPKAMRDRINAVVNARY